MHSARWTEQASKLAAELWKLKVPASLIAVKLATTRNAVLGRVYRMGLIGKGPKPSTPRPHPNHRRYKQRRVRSDGALTAPPIPLPIPSNAAERSFNDLCGPSYDIMELKWGVCKWPIGDPDKEYFCYCGAHAIQGPYCTAHTEIAHAQPWR